MEELAELAKKDPAAAAEALDAFEAQAEDRDVESAFVESGKAASKEDKAIGFEPGEEPPEGLTETDKKHRRLQETSASTELEAAMAARGDPRPPGHDTHHIVADADPRAAVARKILLEAGINPRNNPENGIHLPRTSMDATTIPDAATRHQTIHTDAYYKELTLRLVEAKKNGTVPETLRQIRAEIAEGTFLSAPKVAGTQGETFADWLVRNSDKFEGMTREEIAEVVDAVTRKPRTQVP
ncbi:MAG: AHH domain-containing protein [Microlunatus sp.]|nr:AHH domain-containing protein [Microlunatus sp.]